jgi:shikimate dehydrogenase
MGARQFGLIGYPLTHSFSAGYFAKKFKEEGIVDAQYDLFPLEHISALEQLFKSRTNLVGLNVTIPYKESVLTYLDELDSLAGEIGACNCIHLVGGKRIGYNTDALGFRNSLVEGLEPHHRRALVFGTGGASKAVCFVLRSLQIEYWQVSRNPVGDRSIPYADCTPDVLQSHLLLINTTPLGTFPNIQDAVPIPYSAISSAHYCYDLVYNPAQTSFLQQAAAQGAKVKNGADMLVIQAEQSWRIWNGI